MNFPQNLPTSDLDLAIDVGRELTLNERRSLEEAFAESELVFKVDVIDFQQVDNEFQTLIKRTGNAWT